MKFPIIKYLVIPIAALLFYAPALAQTPDGETPAEENVCDELQMATPGLYGLCIAYCEAQDLVPVDPEDPDSLGKNAPRKKILENYNKKMRESDPPMPCVQIPVPCWTPEEISVIGTATEHTFRTLRHQIYRGCPEGRVGETWYLEEQGRLYRDDGTPYGAQIWAGASYSTNTGTWACWFEDDFNNIRTRAFWLDSQAEYDAALESILARHSELGWGTWTTEYAEPPCP